MFNASRVEAEETMTPSFSQLPPLRRIATPRPLFSSSSRRKLVLLTRRRSGTIAEGLFIFVLLFGTIDEVARADVVHDQRGVFCTCITRSCILHALKMYTHTYSHHALKTYVQVVPGPPLSLLPGGFWMVATHTNQGTIKIS